MTEITTDAEVATGPPPEPSLLEAIQARVAPLGGVDIELPHRGPMREPPSFD